MSVIFEKVPQSKLVYKASYCGVDEFIRVTRSERPKNVNVAEKWCMQPVYLPCFYEEIAHRVDNFVVRPDDVWVVTFPRSGTTWTQELIWLLMNNLDYKTARDVKLDERYSFLELANILSRDLNLPDEISRTDEMSSPRTIKTHLAAHILPHQLWTVKPKIIYVARNVKDVAISLYYHYRNIHCYPGSFQDFMEIFLADYVVFSPYHSHVIDFWHMRNEENILFLTFEDMKRNHSAVIRKIAKFLGKSLTNKEIIKLEDHLSFSKFSKNPSVNLADFLEDIEKMCNFKMAEKNVKFIRKGDFGAFREEMTPELMEKFDMWTKGQCKKWQCDEKLKKIFFLSEE